MSKRCDRPSSQQGDRTSNFGKLELGDRSPNPTPAQSMTPDSLSQGEEAIRQATLY
jgi:hypothetical protein